MQEINFNNIYEITKDEETAINFCQYHDLLPSFKVCCAIRIEPKQRIHGKNKSWVFRCTKRTCRKEYSLRKNTFFEKSKLEVRQILLIIFYFVNGETKLLTLKKKLNIENEVTLVDWLQFMRDICTSYFIRCPIILGGFGRHVEIDEVHLVKRKYNHGRLVRAQWCFGGYEVESKVGFVCCVENCTREVILPIILQHVRPGTTVTTDLAKIYDNLSEYGYFHLRVNHKRNFVDPITGATTNHVESQWQKIKQFHKERYGTARNTLQSHLDEFLWHQRFKDNFFDFINEIKLSYSGLND